MKTGQMLNIYTKLYRCNKRVRHCSCKNNRLSQIYIRIQPAIHTLVYTHETASLEEQANKIQKKETKLLVVTELEGQQLKRIVKKKQKTKPNVTRNLNKKY